MDDFSLKVWLSENRKSAPVVSGLKSVLAVNGRKRCPIKAISGKPFFSSAIATFMPNNKGESPLRASPTFVPLFLTRCSCLLYTSDAADDLTRVDLGGRRII